MKFVVSFDIENAAFGETFEEAAPEIARILQGVCFAVQSLRLDMSERQPIRDHNGNRIGFYGILEEAEKDA